MKKKRAQPVARTMETAGRRNPAVGRKEEEDKAVDEPVHNGSADAFQAAEGIPVDEDDEEDAHPDAHY
jgi:hypothetical protein